MAKSLFSKATFVAGGITTTAGLATVAYLSTRTTVGDKLQASGLTLISDPDDYKAVLFHNKETANLKELISEEIDYSKHGQQIKAWCEKETKEWFSSDKDKSFINAKAWCVVPTIRTLRDKLGRNLHKETDWQTKFTGFAKQDDTENKLLKALNHGVEDQQLNNASKEGGVKLKEWCNSALELKIYVTDEHRKEENIKTWCLSSEK